MMRKLIAGFASSLDGFIAGPNGEYDWIMIDKEVNFAEEAKKYDAYFYGRITYEQVQSMKMPVSQGSSHYVFSTTLNSVSNGFILINKNIREEVLSIKQQPGKDIALFGGAGLLSSLLNENLVDEISISIIPVILGAGKAMVNINTKRTWLKFIHNRNFSNGTLQVTYKVL